MQWKNFKKVLGFVFDADASVKSQAAAVKAKLRSRTWALECLRKCGLSEKDLVKVYKNFDKAGGRICISDLAPHAY